MAIRTVQLAKVAAQAEQLRLKQLSSRTVTRIVLAAVAAVFLIGMLIAIHVAVGMALGPVVGPVWAVLIVGAFDLVVAAILGSIAAKKGPGVIEQEALRVRMEAQVQIKESLALTTLIGPLARLVGGRKLYGLTLAAMTARYLGGRR